jgi:hypothetical protein
MATSTLRSFRQWWGVGVGMTLSATVLATQRWQLPSNTSTEVRASGPGISAFWRFAFVMVCAALAIGVASYMSLARTDAAKADRVRYGATWGAVALVAAWLNMYFVQHPFLDGQISIWIRLPLIGSVAGLVGGLGSNLLWSSGSAREAGISAARWALALALGGWLAPYAFYFGTAGIDLTEHLGIDADGGAALGMFVTGFLVGYLVALIGSMPGPDSISPDLAAQQL